jgi:hypothetical protein
MRNPWPSLPLEAWRATRETLHRYTQVVGKVQLALTPVINHFWNCTLRLTARGLATSLLVYEDRRFDIELDFVEHQVRVRTSDGRVRTRDLAPRTVAEFHRELLTLLDSLDIHVRIWDQPVEIKSDAIPFSQDLVHSSYDREYAQRFFDVLGRAAQVLEQFRTRFLGKCSGVGFYWGTFDLAVARYSGRRAPGAPQAGTIDREAYSHEVSEVGFWPGDAAYGAPAFFALHYPAPEGFEQARVQPAEASWLAASRCFVLPYETIRTRDPSAQILEFCQSTYEAGAELAGWNRGELERAPQPGGEHARAS